MLLALRLSVSGSTSTPSTGWGRAGWGSGAWGRDVVTNTISDTMSAPDAVSNKNKISFSVSDSASATDSGNYQGWVNQTTPSTTWR